MGRRKKGKNPSVVGLQQNPVSDPKPDRKDDMSIPEKEMEIRKRRQRDGKSAGGEAPVE